MADPTGHAINAAGADVAPGTGFGTEVKMVPATTRLACGAVGAPAQPDCVCTAIVTTNCFPVSWTVGTPGMIPDILDGRPSGIPDPTLRGPAMIQIGTEGGLLPQPALLLNTPVGYEQNKRNIVVLNVSQKTLFLAAAERADVIVDFTNFAGKTVILYNDSPAPVPAGDPRYDFYTGNLDYSATAGANNQGGAPSTIAGFGPNTRTIMQFRVAGSGGTAPVDDYDATPTGIYAKLQNATTGLPAIFKASLDTPIVPESAYNAIGYTGGAATDTYARIQDLSLTFTPYGSATATTIPMKNKTIQELFDTEGRMNATLGVELPFTNAGIQTTVPLGFIDPTTETIASHETQLWKITHNGVDTHGVHFHLVNVQVVNRVGWDGAIRPPDANELGWKETVRMNPLEDIIVAMKAKVPVVPFGIPNSIRAMNPAMPVGSTFASFDPLTGAPATVTNAVVNFGHEYTWHCHILGHEENDMMRPFVLLPITPDFNLDTKADIIWRNTSTGDNAVWYMDGTTHVGGTLIDALPTAAWRIVGSGDFNNDGYPDLVWRNYTTGQNAIWYMNKTTHTGGTLIQSLADVNWKIVGVGDFNNDGKPDLVWRNTSTGENAIWYMDGATRIGGGYFDTLADVNWKIVGVGDFNNDGKPDLVWRNTSTGENALWYMDGATHTGGTVFTSLASTAWKIVGVGDYNSDGYPDILWRNSTTGENAYWYMNNATRLGGTTFETLADVNWAIAGGENNY